MRRSMRDSSSAIVRYQRSRALIVFHTPVFASSIRAIFRARGRSCFWKNEEGKRKVDEVEKRISVWDMDSFDCSNTNGNRRAWQELVRDILRTSRFGQKEKILRFAEPYIVYLSLFAILLLPQHNRFVQLPPF